MTLIRAVRSADPYPISLLAITCSYHPVLSRAPFTRIRHLFQSLSVIHFELLHACSYTAGPQFIV